MPADKTSRTPDSFAPKLDREAIELPDLDLDALRAPHGEPPNADRAKNPPPRTGPGARDGGGGVGRGRPAAPGRRYAFRRS